MRLLHTMLRVGNLERSVKFYTEVLGMKLLRTTDRPEQKYSLAFVGYDTDPVAVLDRFAASADRSRELRSSDQSRASGGEGGIRTPDTVTRMPHFECGAFNHSATSPETTAENRGQRRLCIGRHPAEQGRRFLAPASAFCSLLGVRPQAAGAL